MTGGDRWVREFSAKKKKSDADKGSKNYSKREKLHVKGGADRNGGGSRGGRRGSGTGMY